MNIGKAIRYYRKEQKLTQLELAIKMGKDTSNTIYLAEKNKSGFWIYNLIIIAQLLNVKLSQLIQKAEEYD